MPEIHIGKGPDFKITRGKELLSYNATTVIITSGVSSRGAFTSNFSLAMLCRKLRDIQKAHEAVPVEWTVDYTNFIILESASDDGFIKIRTRIKLLYGMTPPQRREISMYIGNFFEIDESTPKPVQSKNL